MTDVYILTARGTAKELRALVDLSNDYHFLGFIDDNTTINNEISGRFADIPKLIQSNNTFILSALGSYKSMKIRRQILLQIPRNKLTGFISEDALVYPGASVDKSAVIFPKSIISVSCKVSAHSLIYHGCVVSHDSTVGEFCIVANNATISGDVVINPNTYIGAGSTITEGVTIGENCIIAAGATLYKDLPSNTIYINDKNTRENHYL